MALPPNGTLPVKDDITASETEIHEVEEDLSKIEDILAENPTLVGGEDVKDLLARLNSADNMAQDVESKLDSVLSKLDNLLDVLGLAEEPADNASTSVEGTQPEEA